MPDTVADAIQASREQARDIVRKSTAKPVQEMLQAAARDLEKRLKGAKKGLFTTEQAKATLTQIRAVLQQLQPQMKTTLVNQVGNVAQASAEQQIDYLETLDKKFRGVGSQPLAIDDAAVFDAAKEGARQSLLDRISGGEKGPKKQRGILQRYGDAVIDHFNGILRTAVLARKPHQDVVDEITDASPFLKGAPAHWAERIVRTELQNAHNRAGWESTREMNEELNDMVKILCATFDDRTAADSYAVHGQIRRPDEPFDTWFGAMQHPPARPNDREVVVPHRISWGIPAELRWKSDAEVSKRWKKEKRKGSPPRRPKMTTVPLAKFGH